MWYHYVLVALGLYVVLSGIYDLVTNKQAFNAVGWTMWSITRVVGLVILYIGWSGLSAPAVPAYAPTTGMIGSGKRRYRR